MTTGSCDLLLPMSYIRIIKTVIERLLSSLCDLLISGRGSQPGFKGHHTVSLLRLIGASRGRAGAASESRWASVATVGASNAARIGISTPSTDRIRLVRRVTSSESPPLLQNLTSF